MKKGLAILIGGCMLALSLTGCGGSGSSAAGGSSGSVATGSDGAKVFQVGVLQQMEHEALDAATQGFQDALKEALGDQVEITVQNAQNDSNTCTTIATSFVSSGVDLIMANATNALQAAAAATDTIPILGTSITEYGVALSLSDFNGTVAPLDQQAAMLQEWFPDAEKVGLLYCSGEPNSQYQVDVVKAELEEMGYTCTLYPFSDSNDLATITTSAAAESDVIYVPTDNTVASNTGIVDGICRPAKVPVIAGEEGICAGCGVATLSISYYDIGYKTGEMAAQILTGEADIATMPIEYAPQFTKKYNAAICEELGLTAPEGYEAIG